MYKSIKQIKNLKNNVPFWRRMESCTTLIFAVRGFSWYFSWYFNQHWLDTRNIYYLLCYHSNPQFFLYNCWFVFIFILNVVNYKQVLIIMLTYFFFLPTPSYDQDLFLIWKGSQLAGSGHHIGVPGIEPGLVASKEKHLTHSVILWPYINIILIFKIYIWQKNKVLDTRPGLYRAPSYMLGQ